MALNDDYDRFMREIRQAGISRAAAESLLDRIFPQSPDGTRWKIEVANDGTLSATEV